MHGTNSSSHLEDKVDAKASNKSNVKARKAGGAEAAGNGRRRCISSLNRLSPKLASVITFPLDLVFSVEQNTI